MRPSRFLRASRGEILLVHLQPSHPKGTSSVIPLPVGNCPMVNLLLPIGRVGSDFSTLVLAPIIAL
ncbi:hypothetical protein SBA1_60023 [Candidatus Sulfotelmatobacter kueseliae]|uniref:Uncharacterized protein n=1 Tax=Candidatus Sulfotelmatobacter kueseliae TaxID=2042962 RepID=A0A2U3L105_9BACT|nr:hypothetical protein SBA1_60023 [Candidatus Sulfotelmatobacter kueseliae]